MKIMAASVVVLVAFLGCGGGGGSGTASVVPTVHDVDSGDQRAAIGTLVIGPFTLPGGATVTYTIVDKPTGLGSDTMDFQITSANGSGPAYGEKTGVSSTGATTSALPADDYALVARCRNIVDDCFFGETITAIY
jgi:hypothetical protein